VIGTLLGTGPFRLVFCATALEVNGAFFVREKEKVVFDLGDAAQIVESTCRRSRATWLGNCRTTSTPVC
jgi:hypothetical protein